MDESGKETRKTRFQCENCEYVNELVQDPELDDVPTPPGSVGTKKCAKCGTIIMRSFQPPEGLTDAEAAQWARDQHDKMRR